MPDPEQAAEAAWQKQIASHVGELVKKYRRERGLTADELSKKLKKEVGVSMGRTVIGDLETGTRRSVSESQIRALAFALGVPPLALLVPLGKDTEVEIVPGVASAPWDLARWLLGIAPVEGSTNHEDAIWKKAVAPINMLYRHDDALKTAIGCWKVYEDAKEAFDKLPSEKQGERQHRLIDNLRHSADMAGLDLRIVRREFSARDVRPPWIPEEVSLRLMAIPTEKGHFPSGELINPLGDEPSDA